MASETPQGRQNTIPAADSSQASVRHEGGLNPAFSLGDSLREAENITDEQLAHHAIFAAQRLINRGDVAYQAYSTSEWNDMVNEIVALRAENAELYHRATHDTLTGLLNLAGLATELAKLLEAPGTDPNKLRFLFVDGTNMKSINDNISHDAGDEAIKGTAAVLERSVRQGDIVARIGGDEFVVLFLESTPTATADESVSLETNLRANQEVPSDLSPIEQRIADESFAYLQTVPDFVAQGFDIAVGAADWQGDFNSTKVLAERTMSLVKGIQHQRLGQYRPPAGPATNAS